MSDKPNNPSQRYVNDLNRYNYISGKSQQIRGQMLPFALALVFMVLAGVFGNFNLHVAPENILPPPVLRGDKHNSDMIITNSKRDSTNFMYHG